MIQPLTELEKWHKEKDPWNYNKNVDDQYRLDFLLSEIPKREYKNVLDIGCGQGFITTKLPGKKIYGIDISQEAIKHAKKKSSERITFSQGSIFNLNSLQRNNFDLIIITGVLYPQYIGESSSLIYLILDSLLKKEGILICVHIDEWYDCNFPYLKLKQQYYPYREFNHKLEVYIK